MSFSTIDLMGFRNLSDGTVDVSSPRVFITGENGQGKSNFLDSIYTLCYGSSFRGGDDAGAARTGTRSWALRGLKPDGSDYKVSWSGGRKLIRENDKPVQDRKRLVESNPAIVFCHEDMEFSRGEPERRRFFFDQTAGLVSLGYIDLLRSYRKVLKSRNAALKEGSSDVLDVLDMQMARYGLGLLAERARIAGEFDARFAPRYEEVARLGRRIGVEYRPSWKPDEDEDAVLGRLAASRERERMLGLSLSGPHRDRFAFVDGAFDFTDTASTGQLRLLSLTLRIAQAEYYSLMTGKLPILLLDDVLLELDPEKRKRFMANLPSADQSFFTFLPGEPYGDYATDDTAIYWTSDGRFTRT